MSRPCGCSPDIRALWFALAAAVVAVLMSVYGVVTLINDRADLIERMRDQAAVCGPATATAPRGS